MKKKREMGGEHKRTDLATKGRGKGNVGGESLYDSPKRGVKDSQGGQQRSGKKKAKRTSTYRKGEPLSPQKTGVGIGVGTVRTGKWEANAARVEVGVPRGQRSSSKIRFGTRFFNSGHWFLKKKKVRSLGGGGVGNFAGSNSAKSRD